MNEKDPPSIILPVASSIIAGRMNNRNKTDGIYRA